jgi:hypothetical protein
MVDGAISAYKSKTGRPAAQVLPAVVAELLVPYIPVQSFLSPKASHKRAVATDIAKRISM